MAPEELTDLGFQARMKHNSPFQIFRRATDLKINMKSLQSLITYFAYNPLFRNEMKKKHGMMLGYRGLERPE